MELCLHMYIIFLENKKNINLTFQILLSFQSFKVVSNSKHYLNFQKIFKMESHQHGRPLSALRDEFWMIQKLGCGGFGKVYLIRNRATREYCAAKHQKWASPEIPKLVRREMGILKKLLGRQVKPQTSPFQV